jgi:integrase
VPPQDHRGVLKDMAKSHLKLVKPAIVNRTVAPRRVPNAELRTREYLTEAKVVSLTEAAKGNRYGHRDATMILVAYRHGLRVSELVDLRWNQIDFDTANLSVRRAKKGTPATHPIRGDELRALRKLKREQEPSPPSCSHRSGAHRSPRQGSPGSWSGQEWPLRLAVEAKRLRDDHHLAPRKGNKNALKHAGAASGFDCSHVRSAP